MNENINVIIANEDHIKYVPVVLQTIEKAAKIRGTGIAKRSPEYIEQKMKEGKAIIALASDEFAGFCYIESWGNKQYVANSGLIVAEKFRRMGLAKEIKEKSFELSREKFPNAKLFGLTSSAAVMRINTDLGYTPVSFVELTSDEAFWRGCQGCINYDVLQRTGRKYCICTAMLYEPERIRTTTRYNPQKLLYRLAEVQIKMQEIHFEQLKIQEILQEILSEVKATTNGKEQD
jgi:hypothetical protein